MISDKHTMAVQRDDCESCKGERGDVSLNETGQSEKEQEGKGAGMEGGGGGLRGLEAKNGTR